MKVAICISGHLRNIVTTFPSVRKNILDKIEGEYDIFLSTWNEYGFWTIDDNKGVSNHNMKLDNPEQFKDFIPNLRSYEIENLKDKADTFHEKADTILKKNQNNIRWGRKQNIVGMYYKIWRCNELCKKYSEENNIDYDIVLRIRPDLYINNYPLESVCKNDILYTHSNDNLLSDLIFYGSSDTMDKISNIYIDLEDICEKTKTLFDPHDILLNSIQYYNLKIGLLDNVILNIVNTPKGYCIE